MKKNKDRLFDASQRLEQAEQEVSEAERQLSGTKAEIIGAREDLIQVKTEIREIFMENMKTPENVRNNSPVYQTHDVDYERSR